jgi:geranylgeranyl pyrophosphate synthase
MLSSTKKEAARNVTDKANAMLSCDGLLPRGGRLKNLLGLDGHVDVEDILLDGLIEPIRELVGNPGKEIRGKLVVLAYRLLSKEAEPFVADARKLRTGAEVLELIHAGSLIVDDIEDDSRERRGMPAMHVRHGLPIALNAGNWLYFWPFQLVKDLGLPGDATLAAYESYHRTLLRAHFGQAMDVATRVDRLAQNRVSEVWLASVTLKTGALMGFAMILGGLIAGTGEATARVLDAFGRDLGVVLQMFDDLGNVTGVREPKKRYEDFMLYRPSWAWACAAMHSSPQEYAQFVAAVNRLPDTGDIDAWIKLHDLVSRGREGAQRRLQETFLNLERGLRRNNVEWSKRAFEELRALGEEIAFAYV